MGGIRWTEFILLCLAVLLLNRHLRLKGQIRRLLRQADEVAQGKSEAMLDIALVDSDLEKLAAALNRYYAAQRYRVACAIERETRMKENVAGISHDLRTPLTVIMGHLQLLGASALGPAQAQRVETAMRRARGMARLIADFYEMSLEGEGQAPDLQRLNLSNLLLDFFSENAPLFENQSVQPQIGLPPASVFVRANRGMMERIVQNLSDNALRYGVGQFRITLAQMGESVLLRFDNELPADAHIDVGRLFDCYYSAGRSRRNQGTGLGLAVVKLLAEKQGGKVSARVDQGRLSICLKLTRCE